MDAEGDIRIVPAEAGDAPELLEVQRRAFAPAAARYRIPDLPPLMETVEDVERDIASTVVLKAVDATGRAVGAVRGEDRGGSVYVGRLVVDPTYQRRGVARRLMLALEERFLEAERFELFTGNLNEPGMGLYAQLGYRETKREVKTDLLSLVYLEKPGPGATARRGSQTGGETP